MKLAYDAQGQRFRKQIGTASAVYFAYDLQGQLLGEYTLSGSTFKPLMEYIWLEGQPVAAVRPTPGSPANAPNSAQEVFYLHTDHLGTPRVALDTAGRVRWRWMGGEPFGLSPAENTPTSGLSELNISLRLPGQQYDGFVGLHYNYFRDYDPTMGRYVQSDPIGLAGGINTYAYVGGNPISRIDPDGRFFFVPPLVWWGVGAIGVGGATWWWATTPPKMSSPTTLEAPYCKVDEFDKKLCDDHYESDRDACLDKFGSGFRGGAFESNLRGCLAWAEVRRNACYRGQRDPGPYSGGDSWPGGRNR